MRCRIPALVIALGRARRGLMLAALVGLATPVAAQTPRETPRDAIGSLIPGSTPTEVSAVASAVVMQIASVPLGSSSGAFTFGQNAATGEVTLKTAGLGPSFAERPATLGKPGAFTFGTTHQRTAFRTFEGVDLRDGSLRADVRLDGRPVRQLFSSAIDVAAATTSFVATLGVTKDIDVGVTVPWVRLSIAGSRTGDAPVALGGGTSFHQVDTAGLGDIQVHAKWSPIQTDRGALGIGFEARLPTGDDAALLGTPGVRPRILFLGSKTAGIVSPHVNLSYQFGTGGAAVRTVPGGADELVQAGIGAELGYTAGVEVAAHARLTLSADLIGRSLRHAARFEYAEHGLAASQGTPELQAALAQLSQAGRASIYSMTPRVDTLNRCLITFGAKATVLGHSVVKLDILGSLNDAGLKPGLTTVFGIEYTF